MQHRNNLKGHVFSDKMINKQLLINLINNMSYKHFTLKRRNELSILLRTKMKKKDIAKLLGKDRTTLWRERKRGAGLNNKYYTRKAKRIAKEKRIKAKEIKISIFFSFRNILLFLINKF